jgi:ribose transport system substrate-binding protein
LEIFGIKIAFRRANTKEASMKVKRICMIFLMILLATSIAFAGGQKETGGGGGSAAPEQVFEPGTRTGMEPDPMRKTTPVKIGLCPTAMNTHYDIVIAGAKTAVAELGGPGVIDLIIQAPSGQSATNEQMDILEGWVQQGYDAITVCSANDQALTPIYRQAADKNIPIFHFNTPLSACINPYFVSCVGYDQSEAGFLIADWLGKNHGNKPFNLVIIEGLPGVHNTERMSGVNRALEKYPNIEVIESQSGDWVRNKSQSVMEDILTKHGEKIDGVLALYDEMALGALAAIKSRNLGKEIFITGYDNTPDANAAIQRGEMHATVDTAPKDMGYQMIHAAYKYIVKGEMVDKVINSELRVWDQSNIDEFDSANYIFVE